MATRKNPSLSDILNSFREAQAKVASDELAPLEEAQACTTCGGEGCPECVDEDALSSAVAALEDAGAVADMANAEADNAEAGLVDAAEALKEVADDFIAEHTDDMAKEAQLFGQLFAASCMEQMNKVASLQQVQEEAYALAQSQLMKCAAESYDYASESLGMEKRAALFQETYRQVMAKFAGYEDAEELDEAAGHELSPEELAAIVAERVQADDDAEGDNALAEALANDDSTLANMSDEEIAALAAHLEGEAEEGDEADEDAPETDPENVAQAAELLSALREGGDEDEAAEGDEEGGLDDVSQDAYAQTLAALHGGDEDGADEGDEEAPDMDEVSDEAYARALEALGAQ